MIQTKNRCPWCLGDPVYMAYHDQEWGKPLKDSRSLFEFLILDGAQAGLSWLTILKKRDGYRAAFDGFDPEKMACYGQKDIQRLMNNSAIVRNSRKIESAINNARAYLDMQTGGEDLGAWLWAWVEDKALVNHWKTLEEIPAWTPLSAHISKELKRRGFTFVGPTIVYAFMQAAGLVNDHLLSCFCHPAYHFGQG
jgi:DNA-3-methyladenine glycosylase I